ncbi:MAG: HD domain-containing protein [Sulfurospirillaceae bacterium]|nr:HD domain-containing protein [Sulfurospirillaceae bacterium]
MTQKDKKFQIETQSEQACFNMPWKVLMANCKPINFALTCEQMQGKVFEDRHILFLQANNYQESHEMVLQHPDIAVVFIDTASKDHKEALKLIKAIRETLHNTLTRIIIRAVRQNPIYEREIIENYDIDDYQTHINNDTLKLYLTLKSAIKSHASLVNIQANQEKLAIYEKIFNASSDMMAVVDKDFRLCEVNSAFCKLLNISKEEIEHQKLEDFVNKEHFEKITKANLISAFAGEKVRLQTSSSIDKFSNGKVLHVDKHYYPIEDKNGVINSVIMSLRDIEELYHSKEKTSQLMMQHNQSLEQMLLSLVDITEKRDSYTAGHAKRVAHYCKIIADAMDIEKKEVDLLYESAMLHDIGKIVTPDAILLKPSRLDKLEYKLIQEHLMVGYEILNQISFFKKHSEIIRYHHERYDGKGYPHGKKADEIPLLSHIMILADAFDAMTSNRIYKTRKTKEEALDELEKLSGRQFHPDIVSVALRILPSENIWTDSIEKEQFPHTKIEEERVAYFFKDALTGAYNDNYLNAILVKNSQNKEYNRISVFYLKNTSQYNKKNGWEDGNDFIREFAQILIKRYCANLVFRIHGDDFLVLGGKELEDDPFPQNLIRAYSDSDITIEYRHVGFNNIMICSLKDLKWIV